MSSQHKLPLVDDVFDACAAAVEANHGQRADEILTSYRRDRLLEIWLAAQGVFPCNETLFAVHRRLEELGHVTNGNAVGDTAVLIAAFVEELQRDRRRSTRNAELPFEMICQWLDLDLKKEHRVQPVHFFDSTLQAQTAFLSLREFQFTNVQTPNILDFHKDVLVTSIYMTTLLERNINVDGELELSASRKVVRIPVHTLLQKGLRLAHLVRGADHIVAKLNMQAPPPCRLYFHLEGWKRADAP